ncbi:alpha/beta fold hydrolase [Cellulosimicrobium cellulans]|uniref:alpha/beta fold hydrolase n=1 Tax=Cellulosimicrobium cellulans TaxID=1710 RepID=UPI0020CC0825|nr:alpha/beta hydrolase [Cellulosimicrobium cellulans]
MPRARRREGSSAGTVLPALQERYDRIDGVRVYSVVAEPDRAGRPEGLAAPAEVVLVHGLALSTRYLEPGVRRLGTDRRTAALDLPGVGRSGRPPHCRRWPRWRTSWPAGWTGSA